MSKNELEKFDILKSEIAVLTKPIMTLAIKSSEDSAKGLDTAKQIKRLDKAVDEKRKELVGPLNAKVKQINTYVKDMMKPLTGADSHLRKELIAWERKLERERIAAQRKLDEEQRQREIEQRKKEEAAKKEQEEVEALFGASDEDPFEEEQRQAEADRKKFLAKEEADAKQKEIANSRVKGTQKFWDFQIYDEQKVPREFLIVDEKKIRDAIKSGSREISGVNIFENTRISIRS